MRKNIKIVKDPENPESVELLAKSIIQVSAGFEKLLKSGLTMKALVVLLQAGIGPDKISRGQIELVLESLPRLKAWYVKT
jgi:hypothetical protein